MYNIPSRVLASRILASRVLVSRVLVPQMTHSIAYAHAPLGKPSRSTVVRAKLLFALSPTVDIWAENDYINHSHFIQLSRRKNAYGHENTNTQHKHVH